MFAAREHVRYQCALIKIEVIAWYLISEKRNFSLEVQKQRSHPCDKFISHNCVQHEAMSALRDLCFKSFWKYYSMRCYVEYHV